MTTDDFIRKAKEVHGDKYDYSNVNYINSDTKVEIICPIHGPFFVSPYHHIKSGTKCQKCSGKAKGSTEDFIKKAAEVHGDKYDYSKVNYKNNYTKVKIVCPIHGEFLQAPTNHLLSGQGCPKCGGTGKISKNEFIINSKEIHGDKYDYSKVEYVNFNEPVTIICPIHGNFQQTPKSHLLTNGCQICALQIRDDKLRGNVDEFIKNAEKIHKGKFNYSKVVYQRSNIPVKIICPIHGTFEQSPNAHLAGNGCPKCAGKYMDTDEFIRRSKEIHGDKFDYSKTKYENHQTKLKIICPIHGEFLQMPGNHLQGQGCPTCLESKGEKLIDELLDNKKIKSVRQHKFIDCTNKVKGKYCRKLPFDFYLPKYNTCIEYDGRQHFIPIFGEDEFKRLKKTDEIKNQYCEENGIKLIRIPYTMKKEDIEPYILSELGM